jgi:hypothetical protein
MTQEEQFKTLEEFADNVLNNQQPLEPEFEKVLHDNFWELLA